MVSRSWVSLCTVSLGAAALLGPGAPASAEESAVTLLTDDSFDAFVREHEFCMIEL